MNDMLKVLFMCILCLIMTIIQFKNLKKGIKKNDKSSKKDK